MASTQEEVLGVKTIAQEILKEYGEIAFLGVKAAPAGFELLVGFSKLEVDVKDLPPSIKGVPIHAMVTGPVVAY